MTATKPSDGPRREEVRAWLAEQLHIAPTDDPQRLRTALLRRLADEDFLPPVSLGSGMSLGEGPADTALLTALEQRTLCDVAAFEAEFFRLTVEERTRRFRALQERCAFAPYLTMRLQRLERGLQVVPPELSDSHTDRLAAQILQLFPLPPLEQARQRHNFLDTCLGEEAAWKAAAKQLRRQRPALAALDDGLLDRLGAQRRDRRRWEDVRPRGVRPPLTSAPRQMPPVPQQPAEFLRFPMWLVFFVVIAALRACVGIHEHRRSAPPPAPRTEAPALPAPPVQSPTLPSSPP